MEKKNSTQLTPRVNILGKILVLVSPFWVKLDCCVFWTRRNGSETCYVFSSESVATVGIHWVELSPPVKLQSCYVDYKMSSMHPKSDDQFLRELSL